MFDPGAIARLCRDNDISYLALFGSYLHGDSSNKSDLDFLVDFSKRKGLFDFIRTQSEIEKFFGKPVDLVTKNALSPYMKDQVLSEAIPIYNYGR